MGRSAHLLSSPGDHETPPPQRDLLVARSLLSFLTFFQVFCDLNTDRRSQAPPLPPLFSFRPGFPQSFSFPFFSTIFDLDDRVLFPPLVLFLPMRGALFWVPLLSFFFSSPTFSQYPLILVFSPFVALVAGSLLMPLRGSD